MSGFVVSKFDDADKNFESSELVHKPVLLDEVLYWISPQDGAKYLDCTFGAGGYTKAILKSSRCHVLAVDQDPATRLFSKEIESEFGERFKFVLGNFSNIGNITQDKYHAVVLDLGMSSMQIDNPARGFSFTSDSALDMRMGTQFYSASDFIRDASESDIADVIYKYGGEVQSRQIAKNIVAERVKTPITTATQLANIVRGAMHYRPSKIDPVTKTFQAIRIYVNDELGALTNFLNQLDRILLPNGKIVIVSFHELEDRIVKHFFKSRSLVIKKKKYQLRDEHARHTYPQGSYLQSDIKHLQSNIKTLNIDATKQVEIDSRIDNAGYDEINQDKLLQSQSKIIDMKANGYVSGGYVDNDANDSYIDGWLKIMTKKPIVPTTNEVLQNKRSRSAKLRVAEKVDLAAIG